MVETGIDPMLVPYYERKLEAHWKLSNASQKARGRKWYPQAFNWAESLSARSSYTTEQVIACMAITSPGIQLVTNLRWTEEVVFSHGRKMVGRFPNNMSKRYRKVLSDVEFAHDFVSGPKVGNFFKNILGNKKLVTLDRWATFAATGWKYDEQNSLKANSKVLKAIEEAYRNVARRKKMNVRDFQAIIWITVRESTPNELGRLRKFKDMEDLV